MIGFPVKFQHFSPHLATVLRVISSNRSSIGAVMHLRRYLVTITKWY